MALKTYLVRAKGDCYYVAQVRARSPKDAVEKAADGHNDLLWYREPDTGFIDELTEHEHVLPSQTSGVFSD